MIVYFEDTKYLLKMMQEMRRNWYCTVFWYIGLHFILNLKLRYCSKVYKITSIGLYFQKEIKVEGVAVFIDPFEEVDEEVWLISLYY